MDSHSLESSLIAKSKSFTRNNEKEVSKIKYDKKFTSLI